MTTTMTMTTATTVKTKKIFHSETALDERSYGMHFRVRCEWLYDVRRASFFMRWNTVALFVAGLGTSGAWFSLLSSLPMWVAPLGGFAGTVALLLNVLTGAARKGYEHERRASNFRELAKKLSPLRNFDDEEYAALNAEIVDLLKDAPAPKDLLAMECHYSTLVFYGHKVSPRSDKWWHRLTKNVFTWDEPARRNLAVAS